MSFDRVSHLPGAVSLLPADETLLQGLTAAIVEEWPELDTELRAEVFSQIADSLRSSLPIEAHLGEVQLLAHNSSEIGTLAGYSLGW